MDRSCPNCGQSVESEKRLCPHCGAAQPSAQPWVSQAAAGDAPASGRLLTGSRGSDRAAGIVAGLLLPALLFLLAVPLGYLSSDRLPFLQLLWMPWCASLVIVPVLVWARARPRFPVFAKALGWTLLSILIAMGVLILGAFVVCTGMMVTEGAKH